MPPASSNGSTVKNITQTLGYGLDVRGQAVQGYTINFETSRGNRGALFVARSDYNPDKVKAMLMEHAQELDAVSALGD